MRSTKCVIGAETIDVVGHRISDGIKGLHDDNVENIKEGRKPTTKREVSAFIGLTVYSREFILNYAAKATPLTDLTRKGQPTKIQWGEAQKESIQHSEE